MRGVLVVLLVLMVFPVFHILALRNQDFDRGVVFDVVPRVLEKSGDLISIQWSGVVMPSEEDYVEYRLRTHSGSVQVIGKIYLSECESWEQGFGVIQREWLNMRHDFELVLRVRNESGVSSGVLRFRNWNEPLQGHLAITDDPTQMRVMWVMHDNSSGVVRYGLRDDALSESVVARSRTYGATDLCNAPANLDSNFLEPGIIYDGLMISLVPEKKYYYQFGSNENWSKIYEFVVPPVGKSVDGVLFGDMGVGVPFSADVESQNMALKTSALVRKVIDSSKTPFVFHIGDISYARGHAFLWEYFFSMIEPIATKAPYMVLIGNHEYDYEGQPWKPDWSNYHTDSGGECGIPYFRRFHMPDDTTSHYSGLWYSFNFGPIHFIAMSSEHNFLTGSDQYNWIVQDLKSVDREKTPWVIFTGHRPFYTSTEQGKGKLLNTHMRDTYEPLLLEHKVDVCFWGHVHHYERTCHYANGKCHKQGEAPIHVVVGNAGNSYQNQYIEIPNAHHYDQPDWVIFRTANFRFGNFQANTTHFKWQLIGDQSGEIHDEFILQK